MAPTTENLQQKRLFERQLAQSKEKQKAMLFMALWVYVPPTLILIWILGLHVPLQAYPNHNRTKKSDTQISKNKNIKANKIIQDAKKKKNLLRN